MKARPIYAWVASLLMWAGIAATTTMCSSAHADSIGVHLYTAHFNNHSLNNINTGLYYWSDSGYVVGAYRNSYDKPTLYAGLHTNWNVWGASFDLMGGIATGYNGVCPYVCKGITPFVIPSMALQMSPSSALRLSIPNAQGVHLSLEWKL